MKGLKTGSAEREAPGETPARMCKSSPALAAHRVTGVPCWLRGKDPALSLLRNRFNLGPGTSAGHIQGQKRGRERERNDCINQHLGSGNHQQEKRLKSIQGAGPEQRDQGQGRLGPGPPLVLAGPKEPF